ncbi:dioxygenase family protein [Parazoarcus communis]|uniref:dioxygenase family protein n=1 Tax=Parazoarcus communis TaxID=41977 RepID=UPI001B7CFAC5|nr:hypothetical protein [Parazoarcus communis]
MRKLDSREHAAPAPQTSRRALLRMAIGGLLLTPVLGYGTRSLVSSSTPQTSSPLPTGPWAGGGTARIGAASRFPNPFTASLEGACRLACETTIGPCHTASPERVDISDGWDGIPLRLALRIVDEQCRPMPNAVVEIWHTNLTGGYSGRIARMCNNDPADVEKQFFRGYQRTDAQGIAHFNSCYPGWYRGRAVHIHLRVQLGDYVAADRAPSSVTTQLLFADELNTAIFTEHPLYQGYGQPDTRLDNDNVVGGEPDKTPYILDVQRMDDGVMFAHKTLVIQGSGQATACSVQGLRGMRPGPGNRPPPDGYPRTPLSNYRG